MRGVPGPELKRSPVSFGLPDCKDEGRVGATAEAGVLMLESQRQQDPILPPLLDNAGPCLPTHYGGSWHVSLNHSSVSALKVTSDWASMQFTSCLPSSTGDRT